MRRIQITLMALAASAATLTAASYDFLSTWKAPGLAPIDFTGRKVVALVITNDESLRMSAEEALASEITARGPQGIAAYRAIPKELLADKEQAHAWFTRTGVAGVVALRIVNTDTVKTYNSVVWSSGYYGSFWDYYPYGWATVTPIGPGKDTLVIAVETLFFDVSDGKLLWGAVTETEDPGSPQEYMKGLAAAVVKEMKKQGIARKGLK
jgi:hypothetical protein